MEARERDWTALGPYLGELAVRQQMTTTILAELVGVHPQTIGKWIFGQSSIQPYCMQKVANLIAFLVWRKMMNLPLYSYSMTEQRKMIECEIVDFKAAVKSPSRILPSAA
jgi:hypothetical protein